jgi:hypothetical protein
LTVSDPPKAAFIPSDGTPASTTALISDYAFFNSLGSMAGREAASSGNSVGISFDGGQFHFEGRDGHTFGIPIVGHVNLTDRVALNYDIPLQYVEVPGSSFFESGVILNFPIQVITPSQDHRWSWEVTPTAAFASTGSKEIMGAGALTNVISYRWRDITLTYGNYLSFFEGETLVSNDPEFPKGISQQIEEWSQSDYSLREGLVMRCLCNLYELLSIGGCQLLLHNRRGIGSSSHDDLRRPGA